MSKKSIQKSMLAILVCIIGMTSVPYASEEEMPSGGLNLWLKADNGVTSDSGLVSKWEDLSGIALEQAAGNRKPKLVQNAINGYPAIEFSNNYLGTTLDTPYTGNYSIYMVMKLPESYSNGATFLSTTNSSGAALSSGQFFLQRATSDGYIKLTFKHADTDSTNQNHALVSPGNLWSGYGIFCITYDGTYFRTFVNGYETYSSADSKLASTRTFNYYGLGARNNTSNFAECEIAEMLIYHKTQSGEERITVQNYLKNKYFDPPFGVEVFENDIIIDDISNTPVTADRIEIDLSAPRLNEIDPLSVNSSNIQLINADTSREYPLQIIYSEAPVKKCILSGFGELEHGSNYKLIIKGESNSVGSPLRGSIQEVPLKTIKRLETTNVRFTDNNNNDIISLKNQTSVSTRVQVKNHMEDSQAAVLIAGLYSGDTLIKISSVKKEITAGSDDWLVVNIPLPADTQNPSYQQGTYRVKTFICDGFETMHVLGITPEFE